MITHIIGWVLLVGIMLGVFAGCSYMMSDMAGTRFLPTFLISTIGVLAFVALVVFAAFLATGSI